MGRTWIKACQGCGEDLQDAIAYHHLVLQLACDGSLPEPDLTALSPSPGMRFTLCVTCAERVHTAIDGALRFARRPGSIQPEVPHAK